MNDSALIIIYGATGDLTVKKILPAICQLLNKNESLYICACARHDFDTLSYLDFVKSSNPLIDTNCLLEKLAYLKIDPEKQNSFLVLNDFINTNFNDSQIIHYFALPPQLFSNYIESLSQSEILKKGDKKHKIILEKPFGHNLRTAKKLNKFLWKFSTEQQLYRIDHYLGKKIVNNITAYRFLNENTARIFDNKIQKIVIFATEKDGILSRGLYYDKAGAVRDMIQSHILQLIALVTMPLPDCNLCEDFTNKKIEALKKLTPQKKTFLFGQYKNYKSEKNVLKNSKTETFVCGQFRSKLNYLKNVPIMISTGKKMAAKDTFIKIFFENGQMLLFDIGNEKILLDDKNLLICTQNDLSCYANLLLSAKEGNKNNFVRFDEIEIAWKITDKINKLKKKVFIYSTNESVK